MIYASHNVCSKTSVAMSIDKKYFKDLYKYLNFLLCFFRIEKHENGSDFRDNCNCFISWNLYVNQSK